MMNTLLESRPRKERRTGGTIFSVLLHSLIAFFAVYASANAGIAEERVNRAEKVTFVKPKAPEPATAVKKKAAPKPPAPLPVAPKAEIAPPKGFKVLEAPVNIPTTIPTIDLSARVTNEDDFTGRAQPGGSSTGTAGGSAVDTDRSYAEFEVERQVRAISGTTVDYPESMRSSGAEGQVLAEFVVNENGRVVNSSFKVLESSNSAFTQAVKNALSRMRFQPAQIGRTNVSQVVQQAFVFKLNR